MTEGQKPGFHEDLSREHDQPLPSVRNFGITFAVIFVIIAAASWYFSGHWTWVWLAVACVFLALTFLLPSVLEPFNKVWFRFSLLLHKIVSPIIMVFLLFVSVVPIGLLMKLLGRDALHRRFDSKAKSYWVRHSSEEDKAGSMHQQF